MYKSALTTITLALATVLLPTHTMAETVAVPAGSQAADTKQATMERPTQGMEGDQVIQHFGNPLSTSNSVGDPPITIWNYEHFTVYFEYNRVIHTVLISQ